MRNEFDLKIDEIKTNVRSVSVDDLKLKDLEQNTNK